MFGRKTGTSATIEGVADALADAESARTAALEAAARAAKAADRAELKAAKRAGRAEIKAATGARRQRLIADAAAKEIADSERAAQLRAAKKLTKQARRTDKNAVLAAKDTAREAAKEAKKVRSLFERATDPKSTKRVLTVAKLVGPALAPVALKAATSTREYLDNRRAAKLGVGVAEVGAFRGPTGHIEARLLGLKRSVDDLRKTHSGDLQATRFADVAAGRISDLTAAVRAAATMPANRRRATVSAVNRELNQIDTDLIGFLVG